MPAKSKNKPPNGRLMVIYYAGIRKKHHRLNKS